MNDLKITCTNINCPERTGGECNAGLGIDTDEMLAELFLSESNAIEGITDEKSLKQAIHAWHYLIEQPILHGGVILKTHKILMLNQPLYPNERGYWRRVPVWIGGHEGIDYHGIPEAIADWIHLGESIKTAEYPAEWIKQLHIHYETIHPFVDGNGRTGRMFMNYQRIKAGLPLLIIFEADRQSYYDWFK